jgi:hypothetical protein
MDSGPSLRSAGMTAVLQNAILPDRICQYIFQSPMKL